MSDNPLYISFIWHMHQPYYKDPMSGLFRLPWVRLHGTKDYLDMLEILRDYPAVRQNFNLVPSLLDQIVDYTDHGGRDVYLEVSRKDAAALTEEEKIFILENFFLANWENMIKPFPRYYELLVKRGTRLIKSDLVRAVKYYTDKDFRDLQVYFNLCWIDPLFRNRDPFLKTLSEKGGNFSEEEKAVLFEKQMEILRMIIPTYREMAASGQVELACTPFDHPILPLLCDTNIARVAMPEVRLPRLRFSHPEDAEKQVAMGLDYFEKIFGHRPSGMWPSEGSVSEDTLKIAGKHNIRWMATDEGVLAGSLKKRIRDSLGNVPEPQLLYKPYVYENVSLVFRDHGLSDLIGFVYSQWDAKKAAEDLISKLLSIRNALPMDSPRLVSIILDGENAWEHYKNDGQDFFRYLYEGLSQEQRLKTVTVSEFITTLYAGDRLDSLHPGSWINANYGIWIGHEEDNLSWDYLTETREDLEQFQRESPDAPVENAWKSLYVAEGSDWNWWYGDEHSTETEKDFDELFRLNLMQVYKEIRKDVPAQLFVPVLREDRGVAPTLTIRGFIKPQIDGIVTSYYEWYQGAQMDVKKSGGSMHKAESLISSIYFGFNKDYLFLRVDPRIPVEEFPDGVEFSIITAKPSQVKISCPLQSSEHQGIFYEKVNDEWVRKKEVYEWAIKDIFEVGIPFADLGAKEKDEINLFISVRINGEEIERCPWRGQISLTVPVADFEAMMWY